MLIQLRRTCDRVMANRRVTYVADFFGLLASFIEESVCKTFKWIANRIYDLHLKASYRVYDNPEVIGETKGDTVTHFRFKPLKEIGFASVASFDPIPIPVLEWEFFEFKAEDLDKGEVD